MSVLFNIGHLDFGTAFTDGSVPTSFDAFTLCLSIVVSILGSLRFVQFVSEAQGFVLVEATLAAVVYGTSSVWSLHFLGMSSVLYPICAPITYVELLVALSCLWPVAAGFFAYACMTRRTFWSEGLQRSNSKMSSHSWATTKMPQLIGSGSHQFLRGTLAAVFMVAGIFLMHYTGSFSMRGLRQAHSLWGILGVVISCVVLNCAAVALILLRHPRGAFVRTGVALLVTAGVAVPHYTSAATVRYYPEDPYAFANCTSGHSVLHSLEEQLGLSHTSNDWHNVLSLTVAGVNLVLMLPASRLLQKQQRLQRWKREADTERVMKAVSSESKMNYPMVAVRADRFMRLGRLRYHEEMRDAGLLTFFDTPEDASKQFIALYSHQWLGWSSADDEGVQYAAMLHATEELMSKEDLSATELYLWVDTMSIPQANGIGAIQNAIDTLAMYSALSSALVVIAPTALHKDTGEICDLSTYMKRCWCRTEQACHILSQGTGRYYILDGDHLKLQADLTDTDMDALFVFEGELTCCRRRHPGGTICDRERLVDTMLPLFHGMLVGNIGEELPEHAKLQKIHELVFTHSSRIFPQKIKVENENGTTTRELFGDLIQRLTKMTKSGAFNKARPFWTSRSSDKVQFVSVVTTTGNVGQGSSGTSLGCQEDRLPRFEPEDVQRLQEELEELKVAAEGGRFPGTNHFVKATL